MTLFIHLAGIQFPIQLQPVLGNRGIIFEKRIEFVILKIIKQDRYGHTGSEKNWCATHYLFIDI